MILPPRYILVGAAVTLGFLTLWHDKSTNSGYWIEAEVQILRSLAISSLDPPPASPTNAVGDDRSAAALGMRLFFDTRLSANGKIACASCHQPQRRFTDGHSKGQALGTSKRNTPSLVGVAYSPWLYWDGRKDSLWSQALAPLEDSEEHGYNRMRMAHLISEIEEYRQLYYTVFGQLPDLSDPQRFPADAMPIGDSEWSNAWIGMTTRDQDAVNTVFANVGKVIAAYIRAIVPGPTRFDAYVQAVVTHQYRVRQPILDRDEIDGLRLFIGKANCLQCHNGPLFTNHEFHNTGTLSAPGETPDLGRILGVEQVLADPFNCLGRFSDDSEKKCAELRFVRTGSELVGSFRTPSLRNLEHTEPYMHKGQLATLTDVLKHYNTSAPAMIGHNETVPLDLSRRELTQLEKFLKSLTGPVIAPSLSQRN